MGAVFGRAMDGESENGRVTRSVKLALIGEAPFLLVTFLWALAKKSDPPTAEAFRTLPQRFPQKRIRQRPHMRRLFVRRARAMPTLGVLEIPHVLVPRQHLRRHLAGVCGMHAVVARGGP